MKGKLSASLLLALCFFCGCTFHSPQVRLIPRGGVFPLNAAEKNRFMSSGEAAVHADPYNSDVANHAGVMNTNPRLSFSYDPDNSSSLIFTDNSGNRIVPYQNGIAVRDFSGADIKTLGSFVPARDDATDYMLQTSYMYIDSSGRAVAPTNDGRAVILRTADSGGNVLSRFEKLADIPVAKLAAAAFPDRRVDKNLLSLVSDYQGNIWFASGGMRVIPDSYPQGFAGYIERDAVKRLIAGETADISGNVHFVLFEGRGELTGEAAENGISSCADGVVVLTNLACYLLRAGSGSEIEQVWKQPYESAGARTAPQGSEYTGGGLAWGSGTTPTLGGGFAFFTDNADPISLIAVDIKTGELAACQPVFDGLGGGVLTSVDNSIAVYSPDGKSGIVLIGNTFGLWSKGIRTDPETGDVQLGGSLVDTTLIKNGNAALQPGFVRIDVTPSRFGEKETYRLSLYPPRRKRSIR